MVLPSAAVRMLRALMLVCAAAACGLGAAACGSSAPTAQTTAGARVTPDPCSTSVAATHHSHLRHRCQHIMESALVDRQVQQPDAATAGASCATPAVAQIYAQSDWLGLARALAVAPDSCLEAWISVPTEPGPDGAWLTTRVGMKRAFAGIGDNVHPMPEVNFNDWNAWGAKHRDVSWLERGRRARAEMERAGYDFDAGDRWALNEVPIAALKDQRDRDAVRDLVRGLQGDSAHPTGVVYVVMTMQSGAMTDAMREELAAWFADAPFWKVMRQAAASWSQEAYASILSTCQPGTAARQQVEAVRAYAYHRERFAERLTQSDESAMRTVLHRGVPLANAAWAWSDAYGFTAVPEALMERFIAVQVAAVAETLPGEDHLTVGFGWAPKRSAGLSDAAYRRKLAGVSAALRDAIVNENRQHDKARIAPCSHPGASLADWTS